MVITFQYSSTIPYTYSNKYFIISKKTVEGKPIFGIMDDEFRIVVPLTYDFIDESDNAENKLEVTKGKSTSFVLFEDLIKNKLCMSVTSHNFVYLFDN
ncbi:hypothetical protein FNJ88_07130 [Chryseobacterium sp. SNU WT5]|uniref:hypothetical protein n=1 Tax=Chryseobacterium sp. SNU WT5 TaxID=2594269 RepID=UPI00117E8679|nr:hypothetical protein [Chryseobacterium sp. SNU WT5]QDP85347.1 hypothetical protein FNJ88_07130 [Chryseobacterium sp. SNU WT5]